MKRKFRNLLIATMVITGVTNTSPAYAASEDECAIWLCLPVGFAFSECTAAYGAMLDRIFSFPPKPPLPLFGSCSVDSPNGGSFTHEVSDYAPCRADETEVEFGFTRGLTRGQYCRSANGDLRSRPRSDRPTHYITVQVGDEIYETYSFQEPDRNFTPIPNPRDPHDPLEECIDANDQHIPNCELR